MFQKQKWLSWQKRWLRCWRCRECSCWCCCQSCSWSGGWSGGWCCGRGSCRGSCAKCGGLCSTGYGFHLRTLFWFLLQLPFAWLVHYYETIINCAGTYLPGCLLVCGWTTAGAYFLINIFQCSILRISGELYGHGPWLMESKAWTRSIT